MTWNFGRFQKNINQKEAQSFIFIFWQQKSFIPKKNMKCTKSLGYIFLKPTDPILSCNSHRGPSINDIGNFSKFLTPPSSMSAVFWYYQLAILTNLWPPLPSICQCYSWATPSINGTDHSQQWFFGCQIQIFCFDELW